MTSRHRARLARALIMSAAATALASGGATAQTKPDQPTSTQVGEVIVTAQHREERLRDVPITIATKTADQLEKAGVTNIESLTTAVPGVRVDDAGTFVQPAIRGVSSTVIGLGTAAAVAIYVDGVYQPNELSNHFDFADLARVEVDKGPQGTLYGRNATGGAIAVFTKAPSFTPSGDFEVGYGNYDDLLVKGFVTGPLIGDVLAGSIAAYYERRKDYDFNIFNGVNGFRPSGLESKNLRGKLLFTPANWAKLTLTVAYQDRMDTDVSDANPLHGNTIGAQDAQDPGGAVIATKPHDISQDFPGYLHYHQWSTTLKGEFNFAFGTVTSIANGVYFWDKSGFDDDRSYNPLQSVAPAGDAYLIYQKEHSYSEDLTFASRKWGGFSFIAGGSYYFDNNYYAPNYGYSGSNPTPYFLLYNQYPDTALAAFVEATYDVTDRLSLVAGVRYTTEHINDSGAYVIPALGYFAIVNGSGGADPKPVTLATTFSAATPRASVRYKLTDDTNVYFTFSQGFKSGGLGATGFLTDVQPDLTAAQGGLAPFRPETNTSYEVGVKSSPTGRVNVNLSAFLYDYSNLQVQVDLNGAGGVISNAASARIYGLDADVTARLTDAFTLTGSVELLSAKYSSFENASVLEPINTNPGPGMYNCGGVAPVFANPGKAAGNCLVSENLKGFTLPRAPDVTLTLNADYRKDFSAGTLDLNATGYYSGKLYFDSNERISQSPYAILNARASWKPAGSKFRFDVWAKNLTDTVYKESVYEDANSDGVGYGPPPTYGAAIRYSF